LNNLKDGFSKLQKPIIKSKINWNVELYKDKSSDLPEMKLNCDSNTELKLLTVAVVVSVAVALSFATCKICRMLKK